MFSILGGDGKEYGPVAVAKIQEWIAAGRANLQTKARRANDAEWRTLGEFPEFNGAPADAAAPGLATPAAPLAPVAATPVAAAAPDGSVLADPGMRLVAALLD